jgi:hypothetical protein
MSFTAACLAPEGETPCPEPLFQQAPNALQGRADASNRHSAMPRNDTVNGADRDSEWSDARQLARRRDRKVLRGCFKKLLKLFSPVPMKGVDAERLSGKFRMAWRKDSNPVGKGKHQSF